MAVIFNQNIPKNIATATSLTSGEVIRKEKVTQSGIHHLINHTNKGIEEQLQNGVIAPKNDAKRYSSQNNLFLVRKSLIFSMGRYELTKVMIWVTKTSNMIILILSNMKKLRA
jgi:hypothetical protein